MLFQRALAFVGEKAAGFEVGVILCGDAGPRFVVGFFAITMGGGDLRAERECYGNYGPDEFFSC